MWPALLALIPLVLVLVTTVVFWPRPVSVEVSKDALTIRGSVYGRRIPIADLKLDSARTVELAHAPELGLKYRTNGVRLPNYRLGWFKLMNGERALCFLTSTKTALYVPTKRNFVVLLAVTDPSELLAALRESASREQSAR